MSSHSTFDPESFQHVLAGAFTVQESEMDAESRSALVNVRRLVMSGELDVNGAMHLIADRARNVTNADGVAIGLVKGHQLLYRAGSGSAATYIGRQVTATLSVSSKAGANQQILRVEDAETDPRIEAAICRQFGAKSLLILPIYQGRAFAGVFEVFFHQAHKFQDREVCTYQLMSWLVGQAMSDAVLVQQKKGGDLADPAPVVERVIPRAHNFPKNTGLLSSNYAFCPNCGAAIAGAKKLPSRSPLVPAAEPAKIASARHAPAEMRWWRLADRTAVVAVLVIATSIAYSYRHTTLSLGAVERQASATAPDVPSMAADLVPTMKGMSSAAAVPVNYRKKAFRRTPRRLRIGNEEIDYLSEDVTVRHFRRAPSLQQARVGDYRVDYVSEDVTVRHFMPPKQPMEGTAGRSTSVK